MGGLGVGVWGLVQAAFQTTHCRSTQNTVPLRLLRKCLDLKCLTLSPRARKSLRLLLVPTLASPGNSFCRCALFWLSLSHSLFAFTFLPGEIKGQHH